MVLDIICRTMYCQNCFGRGDPQPGHWAALYGFSKQRYFAVKILGGVRGFTPHVICLLQTTGKNVVIETSCSVCQHTVKVKNDEETIKQIARSIKQMPYDEYVAMANNPDLGYRVD